MANKKLHWRKPYKNATCTEYRETGSRHPLATVWESDRSFQEGRPVYEMRVHSGEGIPLFSFESEEEARKVAEAMVLTRMYARLLPL